MLQEHEKSLIRASVEALRNGLQGFTSRRPQLEMMATVANAIGDCHEPEDTNRTGRNIAIVEAGTGTGKTLAYLIPAIVLAKSRGKHLIISTSTIALQHQITTKDLPLQRLLPVQFTAALAKGRARYVASQN